MLGFYCPVLQRLVVVLALLLLSEFFLSLKCAALETWSCQRKQTQPEPRNRGPVFPKKQKSSIWGEKFFSLWHANLRVALQHILNPLDRPTLCFPAPHYFCWISNTRASDGTDWGGACRISLRKRRGAWRKYGEVGLSRTYMRGRWEKRQKISPIFKLRTYLLNGKCTIWFLVPFKKKSQLHNVKHIQSNQGNFIVPRQIHDF